MITSDKIAILALVVSIFSFISQFWPVNPKIYGKIISLTVSPSEVYNYKDLNLQDQKIQGFGYSLKLSFTVLKRDLDIKNFEIYVKYPNDNRKYLTQKIRANDYSQTFLTGETKTLHIPADQELVYINSLEEGRTNPYYINFIVPRPMSSDTRQASNFEEIEFKFYDFKNRTYSIIFYSRDIDPKLMLFEKELWD